MGFGWVTMQPAWRSLQAWQQNHAAFRAQFENDSALINDSLSTAISNQISGRTMLTMQAAQKRIQAAVTAKINKLA